MLFIYVCVISISSEQGSEVLLQALERVNSSLDVSHFIGQAAAFAATREDGFVVVGKRSLPKRRSDYNDKVISIFKASKDDLDDMWQLATPLVMNWDLLFTEDGLALWYAIKSIGHRPAFCRVYLSNWSISRVYLVGFPSMYTFPDGIIPDEEDVDYEDVGTKKRRYPGIPAVGYSLALKVIKEQTNFQMELNALQVIARQYFKEEKISSFYALGYMDFSESPSTLHCFEGQEEYMATLSGEKKKKVYESLKNISEVSGWWNETPPFPSIGGVFFMKIGKNIEETMEPHKLFADALESLHTVHRAGFCHRDLRKPNLLIFDGKVQVVDFGDAIKKKTKIIQLRGGAREDVMPIRVQKLKPEELYAWRKEDDVEMLANAIVL